MFNHILTEFIADFFMARRVTHLHTIIVAVCVLFLIKISHGAIIVNSPDISVGL